MLERDIVAAILRLLKKTPDCFAWKEHGGMYGTAGIPDVIVCYRGRFVAFEVKTPSGKLTKLQENTMTRATFSFASIWTVCFAAITPAA